MPLFGPLFNDVCCVLNTLPLNDRYVRAEAGQPPVDSRFRVNTQAISLVKFSFEGFIFVSY